LTRTTPDRAESRRPKAPATTSRSRFALIAGKVARLFSLDRVWEDINAGSLPSALSSIIDIEIEMVLLFPYFYTHGSILSTIVLQDNQKATEKLNKIEVGYLQENAYFKRQEEHNSQ
jgi:hypothetical protein